MAVLADVVVLFVALLHLYILVLEMFWWDKPRGLKAFNNTLEFAQSTKVLAANQGLYNGFLAAGLLWGLSGLALGGDTSSSATAVKAFFLLCVAVAGLYGGYTVSKRIIYIQTVPAIIGLLLLWIA